MAFDGSYFPFGPKEILEDLNNNGSFKFPYGLDNFSEPPLYDGSPIYDYEQLVINFVFPTYEEHHGVVAKIFSTIIMLRFGKGYFGRIFR